MNKLTKETMDDIRREVENKMDYLEDEINTELRNIIDNKLGIDTDSEEWEDAIVYAREIFFTQ
jgi:LPS O-antigen subunit length determinant protein (WzzB/FepE family)